MGTNAPARSSNSLPEPISIAFTIYPSADISLNTAQAESNELARYCTPGELAERHRYKQNCSEDF